MILLLFFLAGIGWYFGGFWGAVALVGGFLLLGTLNAIAEGN